LALAAAPEAVAAEPEAKPLFELGVAGVGGYLPDYPAAGQSHFQGIALPYLAYRGRILRSDEKGVLRGRLVRGKGLELDLSLSGSFAADSDDNDARTGLPDLDYLGEIGPRLQITLARAARDAKIDFELPVRAVLSSDFSDLNYRGLLTAPQIAYQHDDLNGRGLEVKLGLTASFATNEFMDYFYEVEPRFATASRPAFSARAGYLGSRLQLSGSQRLGPRWRLFFALRGDSHHGAANERSPLFLERLTWGAGGGLIWSFFHSERRGVE
jgi:outer membrane scaffolding protein for murein synthesis (MipA/OmpV family)